MARTEQASQTVRSRDPLLACAPPRQQLGAARAGVNFTVAGRGRDAAKGATISAFLVTLLFIALWAAFVYRGLPERSASTGPSCPAESALNEHLRHMTEKAAESARTNHWQWHSTQLSGIPSATMFTQYDLLLPASGLQSSRPQMMFACSAYRRCLHCSETHVDAQEGS